MTANLWTSPTTPLDRLKEQITDFMWQHVDQAKDTNNHWNAEWLADKALTEFLAIGYNQPPITYFYNLAEQVIAGRKRNLEESESISG